MRKKYLWINKHCVNCFNIKSQKPSIFNTILDIAVLEKNTGSRTGSLSLDTSNDVLNSQLHLLQCHQNGETEHSTSLANLARRTTLRKRSLRYVKF